MDRKRYRDPESITPFGDFFGFGEWLQLSVIVMVVRNKGIFFVFLRWYDCRISLGIEAIEQAVQQDSNITCPAVQSSFLRPKTSEHWLQGVFAVQFAGGSPYLASLGFNKATTALIWVAGPLSGALGQPYFGLCSDQSRCSWGKRRPYIAIGAICIIACLFGLAWTPEIAHFIAGGLGCPKNGTFIKNTTMIVATISIYGLNVAIQPVQGGMRALFVDSCPTDQLDDVSAWAARMTSIGSLLGYGLGFVKLPYLLPFFGDSQFKVLSVLASSTLAVTIFILCLAVHERNPSTDDLPDQKLGSFIGKFRHIFSGLSRMPPGVVQVCRVQFAAWSAWFLFLYYITSYVGQIYVSEYHDRHPSLSKEVQLIVREDGVRRGSFALLVFATVSLITGICVPLLTSQNHRNIKTIPGIKSRHWFPDLSLKSCWLLAHLLFAICMFSIPFINTVTTATVLTGAVGISWAMTCWVPYALISTELSRLNEDRRPLGEEYETQTGILIGLHNMAIAAPQLVSTLASSLVFWMWNQEAGKNDADALAWVLMAGGFSALVAAYLATRLSGPQLVIY
ncbi:hypothetical protein V501_01328 [Pseudogymnoascus sp. VKM F-4519 (FW-2642)]|nr:hypothetical protein V501_01328 [Pseudogymnoascus sp. VKM F-4519 (FW-2642)]